MKVKPFRIGIVLFSTVFLMGCVSSKEHEALKEEYQKLVEELDTTRSRAEERGQILNELLMTLENSQSEGVEKESLLSDMNAKLIQMKTSAKAQERRIKELKIIAQQSEKKAAREKQIFDQLMGELKPMVDSGEVEIIKISGITRIRLAEHVLFSSGKADLITSGENVLLKVGNQLKRLADRRIMIEGHTDSVPIGKKLQSVYPSNLELSAARAFSVHEFLNGNLKIPDKNLAVVAFGAYRPIDSNNTEKGRKKNRRVALVLEPVNE